MLPTTTIKYRSTTTPTALAVTGSSSSIPMIGLGVAMFVIGLVLFEIRAVRSR